MPRLACIVVVFLVALGGAALLVVARGGAAAVDAGRRLYAHRQVLRSFGQAPPAPPPALVWLGDSTIMEAANVSSYPSIVASRYLGPRGTRGPAFAAMGFDFYAYNSLVDDALDLGPHAIVMIANFRVSIAAGGVRGFNDLTGEMPLSRLPEMLALPYNFRGMTAPRLLLAQTLTTRAGEAGFSFAEGVRSGFQERAEWERLGPVAPRALTEWEKFVAGRDTVLGDYRHTIGPGAPLMRFAAAAVARAVARGARVLVVITPVPIERLRGKGWYDAAEYARRAAVVRRTVEGAGGRVLDLHDALPEPLFRDAGGHFTAEGSGRMAELVWPAIADLLGVPAH